MAVVTGVRCMWEGCTSVNLPIGAAVSKDEGRNSCHAFKHILLSSADVIREAESLAILVGIRQQHYILTQLMLFS